MNNLNTINTKFNYPCEQLDSTFALFRDLCEERRDELSGGFAGNTKMHLPNNISMDVDHMLEKKRIKLIDRYLLGLKMMSLQKTVGTELQ